jgi:FixJ family two-component response regulator
MAAGAAAAIARRHAREMDVGSGSGLVLLVEDDDGMRAALARVLSIAGFQVHAFASAEAFQQSAGPPLPACACMVLDIRLPGLSGLDLMQWLRDHQADFPVVMMTAFDTVAAHEQAHQAGASACLLKPFAGQVLLSAVREAIAGTVRS